jgi:hypothetical protein
VRESGRIRMVLVGVNLDVERVGHDLAMLGQALGYLGSNLLIHHDRKKGQRQNKCSVDC